MNRVSIIEEAKTWINTPFKHQGRLKGVGGDCISVLVGIAKKFGYDKKVNFKDDVDYVNYHKMPLNSLLRENMDRYFDKVSFSEGLPADILLFWFVRQPQHVAILLENHLIIHAAENYKVCIHRMNDWWWSRVFGVYRFKGLTQ